MAFGLSWQHVTLALLVIVFVKLLTRARTKLPPGPSGLPLIGSLHKMPPRYPERAFFRWGKEYGSDLVYVKLLWKSTIVLNTVEAAKDLLDKRSAKYSDRPSMILHTEMISQQAALVAIPYGDRFRRHRKWLYDGVGNKEKLKSYQELQRREVNSLVKNLLNDPAHFLDHVHLYFAAIMLQIAYGRRVRSLDDELVQAGERSVTGANGLGGPGAQFVDLGFPFLQHVPNWFPGAQFKRNALEVRKCVETLKKMGYDIIQADIASGKAEPCIYTSILAEFGGSLPPDVEDDAKGLPPFNVYGAGVETSRGTLSMILLHLVRNPDMLRKAQEEVDRVVGNDRLPELADRPSLPYLNAFLEEVYRWSPVLPMAVPHRVTADDHYRGYDIPAGSTVISNTWAMTRDPRYFPDPEEFRPERFLVAKEQQGELLLPSSFVFGFGRRVCPGQALADPSLWIAFANVVALFDLCKPLDRDGHEIMPSLEILPGFSSQPAPFTCTIAPRSEKAARMISQLDD
ncbi:cytochrome P450 [Trametes gibbosa]|nr:cytochrome P450 [Trametes gibbosa]